MYQTQAQKDDPCTNGRLENFPYTYEGRTAHDGLEFVSDEAREAEISKIKEKYWPKIRAKGYYLIVKIYQRPEKTAGGIILADTTRDESVFHSLQAQIIDIGPIAYTKREYTGDKIWAKVGDWVMIPRIAGQLIGFKSGNETEKLRIIKDDDVLTVIENPADWEVGVPK